MNIEETRIISTERAWDGAFITWFHGPSLTRGVEAGQFVMVHCSPDGADPMFARAFSYYKIDGDRFALLYAVVGKGTRWLSEQPPGAAVRIYGPLGNGFTFPDTPANLLLIGGGVGIAPLVDTAERAIRAGHQVVAMMGGRSERHLLAASEWPKEVEYVVVTEDGSAGPKGFVTQHLFVRPQPHVPVPRRRPPQQRPPPVPGNPDGRKHALRLGDVLRLRHLHQAPRRQALLQRRPEVQPLRSVLRPRNGTAHGSKRIADRATRPEAAGYPAVV